VCRLFKYIETAKPAVTIMPTSLNKEDRPSQQLNGLERESSHDHLDGEKKEEEPVAPLLASWRKFCRFEEYRYSWGAAGTSVSAFLGEWEERLPLYLDTVLAFKPVLRIHDILGWIRIRIWIRGSMPLD
jgi:hypothetical protein